MSAPLVSQFCHNVFTLMLTFSSLEYNFVLKHQNQWGFSADFDPIDFRCMYKNLHSYFINW